MSSSQSRDRVFNPHGRRHYRRTYSRSEVRAGAVVLALLAGVVAWVGWMGQHPDPELFGNTDLLNPGEAAGGAERGPFPEGIVPDGWDEGPIAHFDADNLYEKINGRAGYFTSKGFVRLSFVSLTASDDATLSLDLELYDLGSGENALGAYSGEKDPEVTPGRARAGLWHRDRNALYLTHGKHYLRAIASAESEAATAALLHVKTALEEALPVSEADAELPWAHTLFASLEVDSGRITYHRENAFSFGFARGVYAARIGTGDTDDTELFVVAASGDGAAAALASRFLEGFASYGERADGEGGVPWVRDRYLGTLAMARAVGPLVCGVRGVPDEAAAAAQLERVCAALEALPDEARARALADAAPGPEASGEAEPAYE